MAWDRLPTALANALLKQQKVKYIEGKDSFEQQKNKRKKADDKKAGKAEHEQKG